MTTCPSVSDRYGVQCVQGLHHKTYELHQWMGEVDGRPDTVVLWSDDESREHMQGERDFFDMAFRVANDDGWSTEMYQEVIKGLLDRLKAKK